MSAPRTQHWRSRRMVQMNGGGFRSCACGSGSEQQTRIPLEEIPAAWKKLVLLSGVIRSPSIHWQNSYFFKSCTVASAAQRKIKACDWREAAICGSTPLSTFLNIWGVKVLTFLWFSQHDSGPSAPIRISGLTCFHTLLPFDCSLPTGSALPAWRQIEKKRHEGSAAAAAASSTIQQLKCQEKPGWILGE